MKRKGGDFVKKSVYSITLLDEVVGRIDRLAYMNNTSRSGMINRILADYLRMATPEIRQRSIFDSLDRLISADEDFRVRSRESESLFAIKSSLRFKYNPSVRYAVALYREMGEFFGELRVVLRTQNAGLVAAFDEFLSVWSGVEKVFCEKGASASGGGGRYTRRLRVPDGAADEEAIGRAAASYIRLFQSALSLYFENINDRRRAIAAVSELYREYARKTSAII